MQPLPLPQIHSNDLLRTVIYPDSDDPADLSGNGSDGVYDRGIPGTGTDIGILGGIQITRTAKMSSCPRNSHTRINNILTEHDVPLEIDPPHLLLKRGDISIVSSDSDTAASDGSGHVYRRGVELGRGAFGVVYRVTRTTSVADFEFAMKVLDPSRFIENQERSIARFRREIGILKQIQHRAIVTYIDAGVDPNGKPYVLMPLIEGSNLREAMLGREIGQVLQTFAEILSGLEYVHSLNIIHRDLKPSNVLVRASDNQPMRD